MGTREVTAWPCGESHGSDQDFLSGRDRRRSGDLALFRRALCQLSYPTAGARLSVAEGCLGNGPDGADLTGFEPATSGLTGRRALLAAPQVPGGLSGFRVPFPGGVGWSECPRKANYYYTPAEGDSPQTHRTIPDAMALGARRTVPPTAGVACTLAAEEVLGVGTYRDRWISCSDDGIAVRGYYIPWGTKHIDYRSIRGMRRVVMSGARGKARIWGTANPRYWASLDPRRPSKSVAFILDLGRTVSPFLTPDDPDDFEEAVRSHTSLGPSGTPRDAPLI